MNTSLLAILRCPFCEGSVEVLSIIKGSGNDIQHGLLNCSRCNFDFPIIGGVAIMRCPDEAVEVKAETTTYTLRTGPCVRDLTHLLKKGETVQAMSLLLAPTGEKGKIFPKLEIPKAGSSDSLSVSPEHRAFPKELHLRRGNRLLGIANRFYRRKYLPKAQLRLADFFECHGSSLSAMDVIDIYYREYSGVETFNYFAFRFGQPRHLAALSIASLLLEKEGPVLDLACGLGHLTHFFASADPDRLVVGLDRDFFRLYVASQYLAPRASFICAAADMPLPFSPATFSGVFCSDAFHYFPYRAASVREMSRVLDQDGLLALCRFGNAEVEPREGYELTIPGYGQLLAEIPHIFFGEDDLVDGYLKRQGPKLENEASEETIRAQKWISAIGCRSFGRLRKRVSFKQWPHGIGRLEVNPLYLAAGTDSNGDLELQFNFPSKWYEFENGRYRDYAPERCQLTRETLEELKRGARPASSDRYLDQFVLLGMPERYRSRNCHT